MSNVTTKLNCSIYGTNDANQNIVFNRAFSASIAHNFNGMSQFGSLLGGFLPVVLPGNAGSLNIFYFKNTSGANGPGILLELTYAGGPALGAKYNISPSGVFIYFGPLGGSAIDGISSSITLAQASTVSGTATYEYYYGA